MFCEAKQIKNLEWKTQNRCLTVSLAYLIFNIAFLLQSLYWNYLKTSFRMLYLTCWVIKNQSVSTPAFNYTAKLFSVAMCDSLFKV